MAIEKSTKLNNKTILVERNFKYNLVELMPQEYFGKLLLTKRKEAKLTQQELADKAGISKSYVSTIENQRPHSITGAISQPERPVVIALVNELNKKLSNDSLIDLNYALHLAGYSSEEIAPGWFSGIEKLSPSSQQLAKKQVRAIIDTLLEQEHDFDYGNFDEE